MLTNNREFIGDVKIEKKKRKGSIGFEKGGYNKNKKKKAIIVL